MARCGRATCEALILMDGWRDSIGGPTCDEKWRGGCAVVKSAEAARRGPAESFRPCGAYEAETLGTGGPLTLRALFRLLVEESST
jgi:hypothetical protein